MKRTKWKHKGVAMAQIFRTGNHSGDFIEGLLRAHRVKQIQAVTADIIGGVFSIYTPLTISCFSKARKLHSTGFASSC